MSRPREGRYLTPEMLERMKCGIFYKNVLRQKKIFSSIFPSFCVIFILFRFALRYCTKELPFLIGGWQNKESFICQVGGNKQTISTKDERAGEC